MIVSKENDVVKQTPTTNVIDVVLMNIIMQHMPKRQEAVEVDDGYYGYNII